MTEAKQSFTMKNIRYGASYIKDSGLFVPVVITDSRYVPLRGVYDNKEDALNEARKVISAQISWLSKKVSEFVAYGQSAIDTENSPLSQAMRSNPINDKCELAHVDKLL